jgi:hypothetical protein
VSQVTTSKSQSQSKITYDNPHKSKKKEMKWQQSPLWKLKLKNCIAYLFLSEGMSLYQEGCYIGFQQSLDAQQKPKKPSEMSKTQ